MPEMLLGVTPGDYTQVRLRFPSFSAVAALRPARKVGVVGKEETTQAAGVRATGGFFDLMGVPALLGRTFGPLDGQRGAAPVAVISYGLWRRAFGADPETIGRTVVVGEDSAPIVGVMPPSFAEPAASEFWVSSDLDSVDSSDFRSGDLTLLGRLRPNVSLTRCNADFNAFRSGESSVSPELEGGVIEEVSESHRKLLLVLLGAVGLLLVIAVFNVANLQLAQVAGRTREIAIRVALGATRGRLLRQFLIESSILGLLGGAGGVASAFLGLRVLIAGVARIIPRAAETTLDDVVLAFACGLSLTAGWFIGSFTVLRIRWVPTNNLRQGAVGSPGAEPGTQRVRYMLTALQVALSVVLLTAAALLMRSFFQLAHSDLGMEPHRALAVSLGGSSASDRDGLLRRLGAMPGVIAAAATDVKPFSGMTVVTGPIQIAGFTQPADRNPMDYTAATPSVTPEYFAAIGMRFAAGGGFPPGDPRSIVVNQAFVKRFVGGAAPLGKMLKANSVTRGPIVGVVNDTRDSDPRRPAWPTIYCPAGDSRWYAETHFILRTNLDNLEFLTGHARSIVRGYNPRIPILSISAMDKLVGESVLMDRLSAMVYGAFAFQALVLCLLGAYGVMSYSVSQRAKEFAVRMALGAKASQVALLPLRQMFPFVMVGLLAGLGGARGLSAFLESQLFEVRPADPYAYLSVTILFLIAAAAACWIPARRAAHSDPLKTLRCD